MLDPAQLQSASDLLFSTWTQRGRLAALPDATRPGSRAEAYRIQALLELRSQHPLFGWKIAATSAAGQKHIGVSGPLAGRILQERVLNPGAAVSLDGNLMKVAEIEFAFRMAHDLPPRPMPYSVDEVLASVGTLHPAIEIPDSRYMDFVHAGECQLIADNACAHQFMLGEATDADWRSLDLASFQVAVRHTQQGRAQALTGIGANVLGDPRVALTWIANELSQHDVTLRKGEVVTTGTCLTPIIVAPGDHVFGDYGPLGQIEARFIA
jgi:2-keto-4-pentenoate hydratase